MRSFGVCCPMVLRINTVGVLGTLLSVYSLGYCLCEYYRRFECAVCGFLRFVCQTLQQRRRARFIYYSGKYPPHRTWCLVLLLNCQWKTDEEAIIVGYLYFSPDMAFSSCFCLPQLPLKVFFFLGAFLILLYSNCVFLLSTRLSYYYFLEDMFSAVLQRLKVIFCFFTSPPNPFF